MRHHRQPEATISRAVHADHRRLIAQLKAVAHVPVGYARIGRAGVRDRPAGEIAIVGQSTRTLQGPHDFFSQDRSGDLLQHSRRFARPRLGQPGQRAADPAVVGPTGLPPGFSYRLILVNRMR